MPSDELAQTLREALRRSGLTVPQQPDPPLDASTLTRKSKKEPAAPEPVKSRAHLLFQGQNNPKKQAHKKRPRLEQWVEVRTAEDGTVTTELYPSNAELIEDGKEMWPAPEIVYRRINFVEGVPPEYYWAIGEEDEQARQFGGCGIQRMTIDTWLDVIERESLRPDGHIGPTGVGNLPRPDGKCSCPVCTANTAILKARGELP